MHSLCTRTDILSPVHRCVLATVWLIDSQTKTTTIYNNVMTAIYCLLLHTGTFLLHASLFFPSKQLLYPPPPLLPFPTTPGPLPIVYTTGSRLHKCCTTHAVLQTTNTAEAPSLKNILYVICCSIKLTSHDPRHRPQNPQNSSEQVISSISGIINSSTLIHLISRKEKKNAPAFDWHTPESLHSPYYYTTYCSVVWGSLVWTTA